MLCVLEAIEEIKEQYFTAVNEKEGREPSLGLVSVIDGTARSIGQLFAASLCQGGPSLSFVAPWVFYYLVGGVETNNTVILQKPKNISNIKILYILLTSKRPKIIRNMTNL